MKLNQVEKRLLSDNSSGSSELAELIIQYTLSYLKQNKFDKGAISHVRDLNVVLSQKFAPMAAVINGITRTEDIINNYYYIPSNIGREIGHYLQYLKNLDGQVIKNCGRLFRRKVTIATYSNSGLIKKVLSHYKKSIRSVYVSEARPAGEGKLMAQFLAKTGINVKYSVDMLFFELMRETDCLIIGADMVGKNAFINKIGSAALLKQAAAEGVKTLVLFESTKIISDNHLQNFRGEYNNIAVWTGKKIRRIEPINRCFEIIPTRLVDYFVSDLGYDTAMSLGQHMCPPIIPQHI
ncbi:MAG: hypothetical protein NTV06_00460 [candidate division Zixibacteria bacterium]|nr:hypothetical protein [candidate division Zixibacteria bacterium]